MKNPKLIFLLLLFTNAVYSQAPSIEWQKCYGGPINEGASSMIPTNDGGYLICGSAASTSGDVSGNYGLSDVWLLKITIAGDILWKKCLGGAGSEAGMRVRQTSDGGYIVGAQTNSNNTGLVGATNGLTDSWIIKLNSAGGITWQKTWGGSSNDYLTDIQQTTDGGYIVSISSDSQDGDIVNPKGDGDAVLLKLDAVGNKTWQKSIGGSHNDAITSIIPTSDGGYICTGSTASNDADVTANPLSVNGITWILKLDPVGNIEWQKTYGSGATYESGNKILPTDDGGYIIAAYCHQAGADVTGYHGGTDGWIIKLDASGNLSWQKTLGGSSEDWIGNVISSGDGGYYCIGGTYSVDGDVTANQGGKDVWLVKLSSTGSLLWQKTFGGINRDEDDAGCISITPDGGLLVATSTSSDNSGDVGSNHSNTGFDDIWVVKLIPTVVPLILGNFDAVAKGQDVLCKWKTMQEQNSSHFIVERSDDALHFSPIGSVAAAGNNMQASNYHFTDQDVLSKAKEYLYYRLKMIDLDGSFKYSNTNRVKLKFASTLSIYPNPVTDQLHFSFSAAVAAESTLIIFNEAGLKVLQQPITILKGNNNIQADIHSLPNGHYFISLSTEKKYQAGFIKLGK